jgi:acyl carrier protein
MTKIVRMEIEDFVQQFASQFEVTPVETFNADLKFRDIGEWDSLTALSIIMLADQEHGVKLTGDDIRNSETIRDIYEKIQSKK